MPLKRGARSTRRIVWLRRVTSDGFHDMVLPAARSAACSRRLSRRSAYHQTPGTSAPVVTSPDPGVRSLR